MTNDRDKGSATSSAVPVYQWTEAVAEAQVGPLTKLACFALARYLPSHDIRPGAFPGTAKLVRDTGMCAKSLSTHLAKAKAANLIDIQPQPAIGSRFAHNLYRPKFPSGLTPLRARANVPGTSEAGCSDIRDTSAPGCDVHRETAAPVYDVRPNYPSADSVATATEHLSFEEQDISAETLALCREIARQAGAPLEPMLGSYRAWAKGRPAPRDPDRAIIGWFQTSGPKWAARNAKKAVAATSASFQPPVRRPAPDPARPPRNIELGAGHYGFVPWLDRLRADGKRDLADALSVAGRMFVDSEHPGSRDWNHLPSLTPIVGGVATITASPQMAASGPEIAGAGQSRSEAA